MKLAAETYELALRENRTSILAKLKCDSPVQVALILEKEGWSREWACRAISQLEVAENPSRLPNGHIINQKTRDRISQKAGLGAGIFFIGLIVTLITFISAFVSGGLIIIAYGAIIVGASMWSSSYPKLKNYPDRRLPVYMPARNSRVHNPGEY